MKFPTEFYLIATFTAMGTFAYLVIEFRLKKAGVRMPMFKTPLDFWRDHVAYLRMAPRHRWSALPVIVS
jgi:hypothetical protein